MKEKSIFKLNGFVALFLALICIIGGIYLFFNTLSVGGIIGAIVVIILGLIIAISLTIVQPNEAKVIRFSAPILVSFVIRDYGQLFLSPSNEAYHCV